MIKKYSKIFHFCRQVFQVSL